MKRIVTFIIMEIVSSFLTVTIIPFMMYFKYWCNDEATALAT